MLFQRLWLLNHWITPCRWFLPQKSSLVFKLKKGTLRGAVRQFLPNHLRNVQNPFGIPWNTAWFIRDPYFMAYCKPYVTRQYHPSCTTNSRSFDHRMCTCEQDQDARWDTISAAGGDRLSQASTFGQRQCASSWDGRRCHKKTWAKNKQPLLGCPVGS